MKDKSRLIRTVLVILLLVFMFAYKYSNKVEYICLVSNTYKGTKITEDMIDLCTSRGRISEKYIVIKEDAIGKCLTENKRKEDLIYPSDLQICSEDKKEVLIELLDKIEILGYRESSEDEEVYYDIYVKDKKLFALNKTTNEERLVFDTEEVDKIAKRDICCTGNAKLLILTTSGNVFMSLKDINYEYTFDSDFLFTRLNTLNIVGFKLVSEIDNGYVSQLYGITSDNREVLIEEN